MTRSRLVCGPMAQEAGVKAKPSKAEQTLSRILDAALECYSAQGIAAIRGLWIDVQ